MTHEELDDTLLFGTKTELEALNGANISYSFCNEYSSMSIYYDDGSIGRLHGLGVTPKCVELFGSEHSFAN